MKRLLAMLVLAAAAVFVTAPAGATVDYTQLEGHIAIVSSTATTVTVEVVQTAGDPAPLILENFCQAGDGVTLWKYAGSERFSVVDGDVVTFNTGPRKYHGKMLTPSWCHANLFYQIDPPSDWVHIWSLDSNVTTFGALP